METYVSLHEFEIYDFLCVRITIHRQCSRAKLKLKKKSEEIKEMANIIL